MRACISYTHPYPIKSLNHTLPIRLCKLCFLANLQVASTLWPNIKSQKLSEHRFRIRWTKSDARTQFKLVRQANPNVDQTRRPNTARQKKLGAVGSPSRPTDLPGRPTRPVGPTASTRARGVSTLVPYVGCDGFTPWLPAINTRGGRD